MWGKMYVLSLPTSNWQKSSLSLDSQIIANGDQMRCNELSTKKGARGSWDIRCGRPRKCNNVYDLEKEKDGNSGKVAIMMTPFWSCLKWWWCRTVDIIYRHYHQFLHRQDGLNVIFMPMKSKCFIDRVYFLVETSHVKAIYCSVILHVPLLSKLF